MNEPLENLYFTWLCAKVVNIRDSSPSLTYWKLLRQLHQTEFVWLLMGDDNRAEDGKELRADFLIEADIPDDIDWRLNNGCSMLEMFIAFAKRAEFQTDDPVKFWFWEFMENIGLRDCSDAANCNEQEIEEILDQVIWRTYDISGHGGIFPLDDPQQDQRGVEIWYQFNYYLVDHDRVP